MINLIVWSILGIPTACFFCDLANHVYEMRYHKSLSIVAKYFILATTMSLAVLKGYSDKDLVTNMREYLEDICISY